jgi:hypothetical protein
MFNPNKPKFPKPEKPTSHTEKLKLLAATFLAVSGTGLMKPDIAKAEIPTPKFDITKISPEIAKKSPQNFRVDRMIDGEKNLESLRFNPFKNDVVVVDGNVNIINGIDSNDLKTYKQNTLSDIKTYGFDLNNGYASSLANIFHTPIGSESGSVAWKKLGGVVLDLGDSKQLSKTSEDIFGPLASGIDKTKILQNGELQPSGKMAYNIKKGTKISPLIKSIKNSKIQIWDIDSLENGGKITVTFKTSVIEIYNPEQIIKNPVKLDEIRRSCQECTIVLFTNPSINGKGEAWDEDYMVKQGENLKKFNTRLAAQFSAEYTNFLQNKPIGPEVQNSATPTAKPIPQTKTAPTPLANKKADFVPGQAPATQTPQVTNKKPDFIPNQAPKPEAPKSQIHSEARKEDTSSIKFVRLPDKLLIGGLLVGETHFDIALNLTKEQMISVNADAFGYKVSINGSEPVVVFKTSETQNIVQSIKFGNSIKAGDRVTFTQAIYKNGVEINAPGGPTSNTYTAQ